MTKNTSCPTEPVITPDQLTAVINELCEASYLAEFLYMAIMRAQETENELSLSFGEGSALVSLMQSLASRIGAASAELVDLKCGIRKEAD